MRKILFCLLLAVMASAQETYDFSRAEHTTPWKVRDYEPGQCKPNEVYFNRQLVKARVCSATNQWTDLATGGGSGNGDPAAYTTVAFNAGSPVITVTKNTGQAFLLTLTGDAVMSVDTSGITNSGRPRITVRACNDSGGAHALTWPASFLNHGTIDGTGNACSSQPFIFDGTNFQSDGPMIVTGTTEAISIPGATSGFVKVVAPAIAGSGTATLIGGTNTIAPTDCGSNFVQKTNADGTVTCAAAAGGGGTDPTDVTILDTAPFHVGMLQNVTNANGWAINGNCSGVFATTSGLTAGQVMSGWWSAVSNTACLIYFPFTNAGALSIKDFLSGVSPTPFNLQVLMERSTFLTNGDQVVGWSQSSTDVNNFVGCYFNASAAKWRAVIISSSSVVGTADVAVTPDTAMHWVRAKGTGVSNSVTCNIGGVSATATGTIPAGDWFAVTGPVGTGATTPASIISEARLHISGRVGN